MKNLLVSIIVITYNQFDYVDLCISSILKNDYTNFELIVVDDNSTDGTFEKLKNKYKSKIRLIATGKTLMAGGSRNLGASFAKGSLLLFIDGDNVIDKHMINALCNGINSLNNVGMVGPLMYYYKKPKIIWWAGADINLWTSKTTYLGINEMDVGQYNQFSLVGHIPNVFMIKKRVWNKVKGIDESYIMHYEESDLAEKIKKLGYNIYRIPNAKTWHNFNVNNKLKLLGISNNLRTYYNSRNRILFMRKNANPFQFFIFLILFLPMITFYYIILILRFGNISIIKSYLRGFFSGLFTNL